ncbi:MAG: tetratricopeptide repeat protein [Bacteroidaceae bacterium]|nr:tetratricopeptide repeat protein [Bacteroidaceae bacterium]
MKKLIFVLIAALGMSCTSYAQMTEKELKKATKEAQKQVKEARNEMERDDIQDKRGAKRLIDQAMKNSLNQDYDQTWLVAADIYQHFYYQENTKSYSQPYDTVGMYKLLTDWYRFAMKADSLQQIPNAKGKTSDEARKKHAKEIHRTMSDLIRGGIFYFNDHQDYAKAYEMFDSYFTVANHPMVKDLTEADSFYIKNKPIYSYYPALAAYNLEEWENVLKYATVALDDEEVGETATEMICDAYGNLQDTVQWLETLKQGLIKYPTVDYYYGKLLNYYNLKNDMTELENFVKEMVEIDPEKAYNYYVLGYVAQQSKDYEKAIAQYQTAIDKDANLSDAYFNLGLCIMFQAQEYMDSKSNLDYRSSAYKKAVQEQKDYYKKALPYFTKYRELEPSATDKWAIPLQTIYYQIDMSKELNEIEARMKEKGML